MTTELRLPRTAWDAHPNYPHQVLLLGSHRNFRSISRRLIERADQGAAPGAVLPSFSWWKSAMGSHEHYEEAKLYPYLEHRWGLTCDHLTAGHHALAVADEDVRAADASTLTEALEAHHQVLMDHLDAEERLVIPALLALQAEEFDDYTHRSLRMLVRETPCHAGAAGCRVCAAT